jgi:hypothetical protein
LVPVLLPLMVRLSELVKARPKVSVLVQPKAEELELLLVLVK